MDKGWFRERPTVDAPPSLPIILTTACEIASAMAFLHGQGIIHGDLTGGMPNALLPCLPACAFPTCSQSPVMVTPKSDMPWHTLQRYG